MIDTSKRNDINDYNRGWYVDIHWTNHRSDKYKKSVIETATPFMNYFLNRLSEIDNWALEDATRIFGEIVEEMPIMSYYINNGEFVIKYNKYTNIRLTDTIRQILRQSKLDKILA